MISRQSFSSSLFFILAALAVAVISGCGDNQAKNETAPQKALAMDSPQEPQLTALKVPFTANPTSPALLEIGDELKIYQKHGLLMDFVGSVPATQEVAAVVSGEIDISQGNHINRTIAGISAGAKVKAIAAKTETTERVPHMIGIVTKTSPIKKPADLVGKKIAIPTLGGCNEYTPYAWLNKFGVPDPKQKVEIIVMPERNIEQALRQGEVDLGMTHKMPEDILRQGEFNVVFSDYDVWKSDGGATPYFVTLKFIQERPEVVKAFVASTAEIINWVNAHPLESRQITAKRSRTNTDVSLISERYYAPNGIIKPETATVWIDLLEEFGEIKPGLTLEQIYTNEFNPHYKLTN
ncbi:MAG: ABC transporter substrate-binding protein [Deltaproteobacteria bacterium]|jgi:ABC-type nitrate/sulfonate/bicarbonate transport system substrate-binding protein|nr:ABC transporter substrate-binding protein [Deltaproteobacteria bacterium]